jgi:hypothetical protein
VTESPRLMPEPARFVLEILGLFCFAYLTAIGTWYLLSGHVTWSGVTFESGMAGTLGIVAGSLYRARREKSRKQ